MYITFLIGNGFDINLGLKTRYSDYYPYFFQNAKEDNIIKEWINGKEQLWADLEEKLGQEVCKVDVNKSDKFYLDKEELDSLLIEYLEKEQNRYSIEDHQEEIVKEFIRSMLKFDENLPQNDKDSIDNTLKSYKDENYIYTFISFNYTNIMDKIIKCVRQKGSTISKHQGSYNNARNNNVGSVLHIHGTTEEEMILGVNDATQIENAELKKDEEFLDTFIKMRMNNSIGQQKTEKAKEIIRQSRIICIFGMSLGNTDKIWWESLIDWLLSYQNAKLIIFWKGAEEELKKKLPSKIIRLNNQIRNILLLKGKGKHTDDELEKIKNRIMISYNSKIFSFPKI